MSAAQWHKALPGWEYAFPRDHYAHPTFKTEWWYFTGQLETASGRDYGYQVTFFRQGLRPPGDGPAPKSRFARGAIHFAHFAISDLQDRRFHFTQKLSRGAYDEAGNGKPGAGRLAWIEDWELRLTGAQSFRFTAEVDGIRLELDLESKKPPVINGENGVSLRAAGDGEATHYYSMGRLQGSGTITRGGKAERVTSSSWLDREWGSNQLGRGQIGWDWFSLQLDDGRELMLYQLRRDDGSDDPHSSGTLVGKSGEATHLNAGAFSLEPIQQWKSKATAASYPIRWRLRVPDQDIDLVVQAAMKDQELALPGIAYWEGAIQVSGSHPGVGYLEMTGYAAPLTVLRR